jgi:hypothetical protein
MQCFTFRTTAVRHCIIAYYCMLLLLLLLLLLARGTCVPRQLCAFALKISDMHCSSCLSCR